MVGLLFGYDWVVIGGAKPFYELYFGISDSPVMQGIAMTTALIGCLVGAMVAGAAADKYGRKPLLMVAAILRYMNSDDFQPALTLDLQIIRNLFDHEAPKVNMFTKESPDELKPKIK